MLGDAQRSLLRMARGNQGREDLEEGMLLLGHQLGFYLRNEATARAVRLEQLRDRITSRCALRMLKANCEHWYNTRSWALSKSRNRRAPLRAHHKPLSERGRFLVAWAHRHATHW